MIIPVRCFTCGKVVGNMWEDWCEMLLQDMTEKEALDELGLERLCCRSQMMTHVPLIDKVCHRIYPLFRVHRTLYKFAQKNGRNPSSITPPPLCPHLMMARQVVVSATSM